MELPPPAASVAPRSILRRFNPEELLARGMNSVKMSTVGGLGWTPPTVAEAARLFPGYEVVALLGHGGMGAVYQARQQSLDRLVAIKVLPLEISVAPEFSDRFRREARAMAKLNHPNIISVHDFGQTSEGHFFFVMEYVDGSMLHDCIHGGRGAGAGCPSLAPADALGIVEQICDALAYAHQQGIVHRDIKPANVMVNSRGRAKVADFGLARMTDPATAEQWGQTMTGMVMGTPDYMAPELKRGAHVDHRADIYALGVLLYEALCKETPQGAFDLPSQRCGTPKELDAIITRAIAPMPEKRFQSTLEMKAAIVAVRPSLLKAAAKQPPKVAAPGGPAKTPRPPATAPAGKKPIVLWGSLAAALLIIAAVIGGLFSQKTSRTAKGPPPGTAGVPPAVAGVPRGTSGVGVAGTTNLSPEMPRETRSTAGGTPTLPGGSLSAAPREWLVSKTVSVPPPPEAREFQGSKFQFVRKSLDWTQAKAEAEALGGHLATITTKEEEDWITQTFGSEIEKNAARFWVGGSQDDLKNPWRWVTGEPVEFALWHRGEPNYTDAKDRTPTPPPSVLAIARQEGRTPELAWAEMPVIKKGPFLVEWDRFSAADAAANDPAKWRDLIAGRKESGKLPATLTAEGAGYRATEKTWMSFGPELREAAIRLRARLPQTDRLKLALHSLVEGEKGESNSFQITTTDYSAESWFSATGKKVLWQRPLPAGPGPLANRTFEFRAVGEMLLFFVDGELLASEKNLATRKGEVAVELPRGSWVDKIELLDLDSFLGPETTIRAPAAAMELTAAPPPPVPETVAPASPKAPSGVEKWLADLDAGMQASFQKEVAQPYESGVAALRTNYQGAVDRGMEAASKAGKLDEAVLWRAEREKFLNSARSVPPDDGDAPSAAVKAMRATYRTQLAKLERDRADRGKAAFAKYDAALSPNILALTQRQRLDDALLLKNKRDEVQKTWLASNGAPPAPKPDAPATLAPGKATPPPFGTASATPPPRAVSKGPPDDAAVRAALEWVLARGGECRVKGAGPLFTLKMGDPVTPGRLHLETLMLKFGSTPPTDAELQTLTALGGMNYSTFQNCDLPDSAFAFLSAFGEAHGLSFINCRQLTDALFDVLPPLPTLVQLQFDGCPRVTGTGLAKLRTSQLTRFTATRTSLTPAGLAALAQHDGLKEIAVQGDAITDAALAPLERLRNLARLDVHLTSVTPAGLTFLNKRKDFERLYFLRGSDSAFAETARTLATTLPRLPGLMLTSKGITADQLRTLAIFKELRLLHVNDTGAGDTIFAEIKALTGLEDLSFEKGNLTDAGLDAVLGLRGLQTLSLTGNLELTDAGLLKLKALKKLQKVTTFTTKVTAAGAAALEKALPGCKVTR